MGIAESGILAKSLNGNGKKLKEFNVAGSGKRDLPVAGLSN